MIDIGGRRLRLVREGREAAPTILLEAGAFGFAADFGALQPRLAAKGLRVLAYDRAGLGLSDAGPKPRDGLAVVSDLEALLSTAGEDGPFVLVGHSMAGLYLRIFAGRNPQKVAGIVLLDAATPEGVEVPQIRKFVGVFAQVSNLGPLGALLGVMPLLSLGPMGDKIGRPRLRRRSGGPSDRPGTTIGAAPSKSGPGSPRPPRPRPCRCSMWIFPSPWSPPHEADRLPGYKALQVRLRWRLAIPSSNTWRAPATTLCSALSTPTRWCGRSSTCRRRGRLRRGGLRHRRRACHRGPDQALRRLRGGAGLKLRSRAWPHHGLFGPQRRR